MNKSTRPTFGSEIEKHMGGELDLYFRGVFGPDRSETFRDSVQEIVDAWEKSGHDWSQINSSAMSDDQVFLLGVLSAMKQ